MRCFFCGNPAAHPATGAQYGPNVVGCRECTVRFWKWFRSRMGNKPGQANFYEAASRFSRSGKVSPETAETERIVPIGKSKKACPE